MTALTVTVILLAALAGGCAASQPGAPSTRSEQANCEGQRAGWVWVPSAGACLSVDGM